MEENLQSIQNNAPVLRPMNSESIGKPMVIGIITFIIILGAFTGYFLTKLGPRAGSTTGSGSNTVEVVNTATSSGIKDKKTFKDTAIGILKEGGFEGEGSYHLIRGAKDQTAYLSSTTIDLSVYVGKKVEVWGQTYASGKAGWLMDVGYVEIVK